MMMNFITNRLFISHILPSLSLSYVMSGIEKSCLRHKYSFPLGLTARRNCKKSATFSIMLVICGLEKFCRSIHHHFLHSDHSQTKKKIIILIITIIITTTTNKLIIIKKNGDKSFHLQGTF